MPLTGVHTGALHAAGYSRRQGPKSLGELTKVGMYESRKDKPLPRREFAQRLLAHVAAALMLLLVSLAAGMWGYNAFEKLAPMDGFLNAAMLLGGMGPVDPPHTSAGKLFAGLYALYAGLVFIVSTALICTPLVHRVLHKFHADDKDL